MSRKNCTVMFMVSLIRFLSDKTGVEILFLFNTNLVVFKKYTSLGFYLQATI